MKTGHFIFFAIFLFIFVTHFFFEESIASIEADEQLHTLLSLQRQIDIYSPLSENHLQGTHNSYNSDAYHHLLNYHDRQQKLSVKQQLNAGARFIELDVHWTLSFNKWPWKQDLLLCHGSSKFKVLPFHWGCSPWDIPLEQVLAEVQAWLEQPKNQQEFLLFYIEDHSEGRHAYLYRLLQQYGIAQRMIESGGCHPIPDTLSKQDVFAQGKQIVFWKDGPCSDYEPLSNLAFSDLGSLLRHAEDRTVMGTVTKGLASGRLPRIEAENVTESFLAGANIVNFDNFVSNDERLHAVLWSWDTAEPIALQEERCATQQPNGRWLSKNCELKRFAAACFHPAEKTWRVTELLYWHEAKTACAEITGYVFSAPVNYIENRYLQQISEQPVWLNITRNIEYLKVGHRRTRLDGGNSAWQQVE